MQTGKKTTEKLSLDREIRKKTLLIAILQDPIKLENI